MKTTLTDKFKTLLNQSAIEPFNREIIRPFENEQQLLTERQVNQKLYIPNPARSVRYSQSDLRNSFDNPGKALK